jgi:hypothetical protein
VRQWPMGRGHAAAEGGGGAAKEGVTSQADAPEAGAPGVFSGG